jgi:hypothetical protein
MIGAAEQSVNTRPAAGAATIGARALPAARGPLTFDDMTGAVLRIRLVAPTL